MQIYFIYIIYIYISDLYLKRKMYSNCNGYLSFDTSSSSIFSLSCASACDSFVNKLHSRWTCVSLWDSLLLCRASAHWKTGELANRWAGEPSAQAIQFSESRTSKRSRRRWFFEGGNNLDIDSVTVGDVFDSHVCQNSRWLFFVEISEIDIRARGVNRCDLTWVQASKSRRVCDCLFHVLRTGQFPEKIRPIWHDRKIAVNCQAAPTWFSIRFTLMCLDLNCFVCSFP